MIEFYPQVVNFLLNNKELIHIFLNIITTITAIVVLVYLYKQNNYLKDERFFNHSIGKINFYSNMINKKTDILLSNDFARIVTSYFNEKKKLSLKEFIKPNTSEGYYKSVFNIYEFIYYISDDKYRIEQSKLNDKKIDDAIEYAKEYMIQLKEFEKGINNEYYQIFEKITEHSAFLDENVFDLLALATDEKKCLTEWKKIGLIEPLNKSCETLLSENDNIQSYKDQISNIEKQVSEYKV